MSQHFIYHIIGERVGVSTNVQKHLAEEGVEPDAYTILQITSSAKNASELEREWQERLGYPLSPTPYHKTLYKVHIKKHYQKIRDKRISNL